MAHAAIGQLFAEAAHGFFFDGEVVRVPGERVLGIPPIAHVVHQFLVNVCRRSMDAGYDLDGETVCARIGDLRYPRNRNQSQQHYCQENFSAHLDFSSEAVYLGKRCHWLLALGCWLLGRAKSKSTPTTEAHHGGLAAHHGGLAARRHGVSRRKNGGKQSQKQNQKPRTAENTEAR